MSENFETFHKKNNYKNYKNNYKTKAEKKYKEEKFEFPVEILKHPDEADHIYDLIPKFWTLNKIMSIVVKLELSLLDDELIGTFLLDDIDFAHVDKDVLIEVLKYNGLILGYLVKHWPKIVDDELIITAVKENGAALIFVDKNLPCYESLDGIIKEAEEEADKADREQDEWIKKEFEEDEKFWAEVNAKKEKEEEIWKKINEEKWGDM